MKTLIHSFGALVLAGLVFMGCEKTEAPSPTNPAATPGVTGSTADDVFSASKAGKGMLWVDCEVYNTIGTPTSFKPGAGKFDAIYTGMFQDGLNISSVAPGDAGFNGGRWEVHALKSGVDPNKYLTACSVADLDVNDFEPNGTYFECPVIPRRGNN